MSPLIFGLTSRSFPSEVEQIYHIFVLFFLSFVVFFLIIKVLYIYLKIQYTFSSIFFLLSGFSFLFFPSFWALLTIVFEAFSLRSEKNYFWHYQFRTGEVKRLIGFQFKSRSFCLQVSSEPDGIFLEKEIYGLFDVFASIVWVENVENYFSSWQ